MTNNQGQGNVPDTFFEDVGQKYGDIEDADKKLEAHQGAYDAVVQKYKDVVGLSEDAMYDLINDTVKRIEEAKGRFDLSESDLDGEKKRLDKSGQNLEDFRKMLGGSGGSSGGQQGGKKGKQP